MNQEQPEQLSQTIEALRSNLAEQPQRYWGRDLGLIGVIVAILGALLWYTTLVERQVPLLAYAAVDSGLPPAEQWAEHGFKQGLVNYLHSSEQLRVVGQPSVLSANYVRASASAQQDRYWAISAFLSSDALPELVVELILRAPYQGREYRTQLAGSVENMPDLVARAAAQIGDWLQLHPLSMQQQLLAQGAMPLAGRSGRDYARGLLALEQGRSREAIEHFTAAGSDNESGAMVVAGLAMAYAELGYTRRAQDLAETALARSTGLPREQQLNVRALHERLLGNWPRVAELNRALWEFYPEQLEYGLQLVNALVQSSEYEIAYTLLEELQQRAEFQGEPRLLLQKLRALASQGRWVEAAEVARTTAERARAQQADGVLADALYLWAEVEPESFPAAALSEAQDLYRDLKDVRGQVEVLGKAGSRALGAGDLEFAGRLLDEGLKLAVSVDNPYLANLINSKRAIWFDLLGDLEQGLLVKQQVLDTWQELNDQQKVALAKENIVISLFKIGRMVEAERRLEDAYQTFLEVDDHIGIAWYPLRMGAIKMRRGELQAALPLTQAGLENAEQYPQGDLATHARDDLARLAFFSGAADAAQQLQAVEAAYRDQELPLFTGAALLFRAKAAPDAATAAEFTRQALEIFNTTTPRYYLAWANTLLVRSGDLSVCGELRHQLNDLHHRLYAILGELELHRCGPEIATVPLTELLAEAQALDLFEPLVEITAWQNLDRGRALADSRGWVHSPHWTYR